MKLDADEAKAMADEVRKPSIESQRKMLNVIGNAIFEAADRGDYHVEIELPCTDEMLQVLTDAGYEAYVIPQGFLYVVW